MTGKSGGKPTASTKGGRHNTKPSNANDPVKGDVKAPSEPIEGHAVNNRNPEPNHGPEPGLEPQKVKDANEGKDVEI